MADRIFFTGSTAAVEPLMVLTVSTTSASTSVVHRIIGRAEPEVTLSPPENEKGRIELLFADAVSASECVILHRQVGVFTLECESFPLWSRRYIVEGTVQATQDPETRRRWLVTIDYRSVSA